MPYSKAKAREEASKLPWPDLRYSPEGEVKLFFSPRDVPLSWTAKPPKNVDVRPTQILDRNVLLEKLKEMGIEPNPLWGNAHMKRIIDGDIRPIG